MLVMAKNVVVIFVAFVGSQGRSQKKLMTEAMSMEDL